MVSGDCNSIFCSLVHTHAAGKLMHIIILQRFFAKQRWQMFIGLKWFILARCQGIAIPCDNNKKNTSCIIQPIVDINRGYKLCYWRKIKLQECKDAFYRCLHAKNCNSSLLLGGYQARWDVMSDMIQISAFRGLRRTCVPSFVAQLLIAQEELAAEETNKQNTQVEILCVIVRHIQGFVCARFMSSYCDCPPEISL